jgi:phosphatidylethanolamine-binding protein (PEBP) family uncharacterized protein
MVIAKASTIAGSPATPVHARRKDAIDTSSSSTRSTPSSTTSASRRKADLERAMSGHVLEQAELIGTYEHEHARAGR